MSPLSCCLHAKAAIDPGGRPVGACDLPELRNAMPAAWAEIERSEAQLAERQQEQAK